MSIFKEKDILDFLNVMSKQNFLNPRTASVQKTAVMKILSALEEEKNNLDEALDINSLIARFQAKAKNDLTENSLNTYAARFKTAFTGYIAWCKDPENYRPKTKYGRSQKEIRKNDFIQLEVDMPSSSSSQHPTIKYPFVTGGYLEIPKTLCPQEVEKLIPLLTAIVKSHECEEDKQY